MGCPCGQEHATFEEWERIHGEFQIPTLVECVCVVPRGSRRMADPQCSSCGGSGKVQVCTLCLGLGRIGDGECWRCEGNCFVSPALPPEPAEAPAADPVSVGGGEPRIRIAE